MQETKRALPILFAVMFLVMVGFGIIIPVLPFYAEDIGANPTQLGFLMGVYSLMQLLFAPMWGRISSRSKTCDHDWDFRTFTFLLFNGSILIIVDVVCC